MKLTPMYVWILKIKTLLLPLKFSKENLKTLLLEKNPLHLAKNQILWRKISVDVQYFIV